MFCFAAYEKFIIGFLVKFCCIFYHVELVVIDKHIKILESN